MIIFCAALSLSHLRCQLSPGESLGLSVLFVWCVPEGFVGVACQGQSLRLPSAATVSLRLGHTRALTTHCVVIHYPRAASLPLHKGGMVGESVHSVGNRIISRFCCFFGGSKPPPYRLGGKPFIRWVTVLFADSVYFTKVDMFDLPCKSNSICKGSAFARYIRLATDAICFSCGKTCCSHQIRYSVPGTHSFLFLYSLRKGATSRLSSQHTQLSHPSTV